MKYFWTDNEELTSKIDSFFAYLRIANMERFNNQLSILLLGSLSRGEATWNVSELGRPYLISDIEFFTVYPDGFDKFADWNNLLDEAKKACFSEEGSVLFYVDNTFVSKTSIGKIERKVITYDAKNMGKTVVGEDVVPLLPEIDLSNINDEDIWDILVHRVFSVMYYGGKLKESGNIEDYRYNIAKNSLDLTTVLLASKGFLISGFSNKVTKLKDLDIDRKYKDYFAYCLKIKLKEKTDFVYSVDEMESIFIEIVKKLQNEYKPNVMNQLINLKYLAKRRCGIIKRMLRAKQFVPGRKIFLNSLIKSYDMKQKIEKKQIAQSFVLNGYPKL